MASKCTVIIENATADPNEKHQYFAYFADQNVDSPSVTKTLQPIFFITRRMSNGDPQDFKITSQLYASIGERMESSSSDAIENYEHMSLPSTEEVHLGTHESGGSFLVVKWDGTNNRPVFDKKEAEETAGRGHFGICCDASIPTPDNRRFVVGLSRQIQKVRRLVAVVPCVPNREYKFSWKEEIYIERYVSPDEFDCENGVIVSGGGRTPRLRVKLGLHMGGSDIYVKERSGFFTVDGKRINPKSTEPEEPMSDEEPPAPPRPARERARAQPNPRTEQASREQHNSAGPQSTPPKAAPPGYPADGTGRAASDSGLGGERTSNNTAPRPSTNPMPSQQDPGSGSAHKPSSNGASSTGHDFPGATHKPPAPGFDRPETGPDEPAGEEINDDDDDDNEAQLSFKRLQNFHTVFVVDDTGSMALPATGDYTGWRQVPRNFTGPSRWAMVLEALKYIADIAVRHDETGIDIHFLIKSRYDRQGIRSSADVGKVLGKLGDVRKNAGPTYFKPTLQPILEGHLRDYRESDIDIDIDRPRPLDLIVLTDGVAKDKGKTEDLIVWMARELSRLDANPRQVGIQFLQVGEDKDAAQFLKHLDDGIKSHEVRDVRSFLLSPSLSLSFSLSLPLPLSSSLPLSACAQEHESAPLHHTC